MKKTVLLTTITAVSLSVTLNVGAVIAPETILPESTLAVFTVRDLQKECAEIQSKPLGLLLKDPAMKPFCDYVGGQILGAIKGLNDELGKKNINLSDYQDILNGGAALALTSFTLTLGENTLENLSVLPLFMAEIKGGSEKIKATLDDLQTKLDTSFESEEIAGNEFRLITGACNEDVTLWVGASGSTLYVAASQNSDEDYTYTRESLGKILSKTTGEKLLAESEFFTKHSRITPDRSYGWINLQTLTQVAKDFATLQDKQYVQPEDLMQAMMSLPRPMVIYNALGISALKSWSFTYWSENGDEWFSSNLLCPQNERRGLTALLDVYGSGDCAPDQSIPGDLMSFSKVQLNLKKFWETIDTITTEAAGGFKIMMMGGLHQALESSPKNIDLEADILNNLTGEMTTITFTAPAGTVKEVESSNNIVSVEIEGVKLELNPSIVNSLLGSVYILGVKDADRFLSTIEALIELFNPGIKDEAMALIQKADGRIVIGSGGEKVPAMQSFLKAAGKPQEKSLANSGALQSAASRLGGFDGAAFGYSNNKQVAAMLYNLWPLIASGLKSQQDIPAEVFIAMEKFPDFEVIEKYLGISAGKSVLTPEGLESISIHPWPAGLKK